MVLIARVLATIIFESDHRLILLIIIQQSIVIFEGSRSIFKIEFELTNLYFRLSAQLQESNRRSYASSLPQRRAVHYQSTGSLHSDSQSSSSVSPIPSPSPRATPLPVTARRAPLQPSNSNNNTSIHKRWSSTGDFLSQNNQSATPHSR